MSRVASLGGIEVQRVNRQNQMNPKISFFQFGQNSLLGTYPEGKS